MDESNSEPNTEEFEFVDLGEDLGVKEIISDHRGAFGEFGGEISKGFLDRAFREKILIVGVVLDGETVEEIEESLDELELLIDTAGADVVDRVIQKRNSPDPAMYIGKGKVEEILELALSYDCDTVVFDNELAPSQQANLEKVLKRTALDRTAVILDIFAQHATSAEGKAQVELAQLRYNLPRLRGKKNFSQQAGGIGTRGPGETQLEVDRRRLVKRIHKLEAELRQIKVKRDSQRKARQSSRTKKVSIVGYTNAGKSSLLSRLTSADVLVEDKLFATLDATTRQFGLPGGEKILLTDTVGFVRKLPHQLIEAFQSTLEVAAAADLLVHVVDASAVDPASNIKAVVEVLEQIGADQVPTILVFNKMDKADRGVLASYSDAIGVSAITGDGIEQLVTVLADAVQLTSQAYELEIPWSRGDVLAQIHREGRVESTRETVDAMQVVARMDTVLAGQLNEFIVGEDA